MEIWTKKEFWVDIFKATVESLVREIEQSKNYEITKVEDKIIPACKWHYSVERILKTLLNVSQNWLANVTKSNQIRWKLVAFKAFDIIFEL